MWCRSAVSFSFLFLVTAPRMRSCACDTASRLCVRTVLCSSAFLSVPLLPSTGSAAECPALFAGFAGIISESDFFVPFIIGYGLRPSRCGPGTASQGGDEDIPVPAQEVCVHAEGLKTTRGGEGPCDDGPAPVAFCLPRRHRHPGLHCFRRSIRAPVNASRTASQQGSVDRYSFTVTDLHRLPPAGLPAHRGSMAGLCSPLPTLRRRPRERQRTAWGRCGSLLLHRSGLAPPTPCRSPGALRVLNAQPRSRSLASAQPGNRHAQSGARLWSLRNDGRSSSPQGRACSLYRPFGRSPSSAY